MRPMLVDELTSSDGTVTRLEPQAWTQVCSFETAQIIGNAMQLAVEGQFGTFAGAAKVPGVPTAGKSGTAQVGRRRSATLWFIGYAPGGRPAHRGGGHRRGRRRGLAARRAHGRPADERLPRRPAIVLGAAREPLGQVGRTICRRLP